MLQSLPLSFKDMKIIHLADIWASKINKISSLIGMCFIIVFKTNRPPAFQLKKRKFHAPAWKIYSNYTSLKLNECTIQHKDKQLQSTLSFRVIYILKKQNNVLWKPNVSTVEIRYKLLSW